MSETCGCCEGIRPLTPAAIANVPGLDALAYRVGTHGSFLTTMLARLSSPDYPALAGLGVRTPDDPAVALLDAWATVADVLTFYQERIANEGYLRTATERRSILELARLVGYRLRPGVAASVYLAFTLDHDPEKETRVTIPAGTRVQSVPGPGEMPQTFETSEDLKARESWNNLRPRLTRPTGITGGNVAKLQRLYFHGTTTNLKPNDRLVPVFATGGAQGVGFPPLEVATVTPDEPSQRTVVILRQPDAQDRSAEAGNEAASPHVVARRDEGNGEDDGKRDITAVGRLSVLLGPLARPPSLQPRHSRELVRVPKDLFGKSSDLAPRLLTTLSPVLAPTLYSAWATADLIGPGPLKSIQAMRVKVAPFGATAPLKPVLDARGAVIGSEEWPLGDPTGIGVTIVYERGNVPTRATVSGNRGGPPGELPVNITAGGTFMLQVGSVTFTVVVQVSEPSPPTPDAGPPPTPEAGPPPVAAQGGTTQRTLTFTFTPDTPPSSPSRTITVIQDDNTTVLGVTFDDDPQVTWRPAIGRTLTYATGDHRITITLTAGTGSDAREAGPAGVVASAAAGPLGTLTISHQSLSEPGGDTILALDAQYDQILPDSWVLIERAGQHPLVTQVKGVATVAKTAFSITAKVTQLTLADSWLQPTDRQLSDIRGVTVYAQSEPLELAWEPLPPGDDVMGAAIELDQLYAGLESGRWVIVSGERADVPSSRGVTSNEVAMLAGVTQDLDQSLPGDKVHTTLHLAKPLAYKFRRETVTIWGNVVKATHGETHAEVLGSGDGTQAMQAFSLHNAPLTYLAADNPLGAQSTLEVRVNEVLWHESDSLVWLGPTDHGFVTRTDNEEKTTVVFGNGLHGARLPTGAENVAARYRSGIGAGGNVKAEQVSQLQTRPLGVGGVINPLPATGGADRDNLDQARANTPLAVMALDRLVSVKDYEDFTRARAGIGKASARHLSDSQREVVHLTIAGAGDIPIDVTSDLFQNLGLALQRSGDPHQPFQVAVRELVLLIVSARVRVAPDYLWMFIEPKVRAALLNEFRFDRRDLGQDVILSEIIATIQAVRGVAYVDVEVMDAVPETVTPAQLETLEQTLIPPPPQRIRMNLAGFRPLIHTVQSGDTLRIIAELFGITLDDLEALNPGVGDPLTAGQIVIVDGPKLRPAQLALISPALPETVILKEIKP